jgi:tetratricopeptide (TPR) repeat protein
MLLRLTQHEEGESRHRVTLRLEGDGGLPWEAESRFEFDFTAQDREDLRWYLEEFLQNPKEPPGVITRIESRIAELGLALFRGAFQGSDDARDLWAQVRDRLAETRLEVVTEVAAATALPWELLCDPKTAKPLALSACSFVRAQPNPARRPHWIPDGVGPVRILVVLCRPGGALGEEDAPFRSVATRLIQGLDAGDRKVYDLDVLRPPTFEALAKALRRAKDEKRPYHVVHFDGHGTYGEIEELREFLRERSPLIFARAGRHGFLAFENPELPGNLELVDGTKLGGLLHECRVPILVLNACRSAHAEPAAAPEAMAVDDPHSQARAFGSFAQEVMDAGVSGVVAMRYNVYVVTAAQLVAELYAALANGQTFGEAATRARKNLAENPLREVLAEPLTLQDWQVPVVYEAAPLRIFPETGRTVAPIFQVGRDGAAGGGEDAGALPPPPDVGFYGRDETLLVMDRAFDRYQVVLLHAYAGSGKTTTAAEFARWYQKTGGVDGPVLFTSFERYLPLPRVLDVVAQVFSSYLEKGGVNWLALDDAQRRHVALQVFERVPALWVWDNVEPVAGFPAGTPSAWNAEEQQELVDFLRALKGTKAKVLLTSRREERGWLGDLPTRIRIPAMPMLERLQLARAIAGKQGKKLAEVDWRPLLAFTEGNPLALTVLVGQALREGLRSKEQVEGFVAKLRAGEVGFADEVGEGRSKSLGTSLAYGFEQAFSEEERRRLAVLALFQGFVNVVALKLMGKLENPGCLVEVRGLEREEWIPLLDRTAEVGLLTAYGGGYYGIHPALPWFFRRLFERFYPRGGRAALRAWVEAVGGLGDYYFWQYTRGHLDVIDVLRAEEANLLHARRLAREYGWWDPVITTMQGLLQLYGHTGRRAEWQRLVEEIVPDFVDSASSGPLPGREEMWSLVAGYRVQLAMEERRWAEAERLQNRRVDWNRERAAGALALDYGELKEEQRNRVRTLAVSLQQLGDIQCRQGRADCAPAYEEALNLAKRINDRAVAAICAFNLGHTYKGLPVLRDLDQAEGWYRRSLGLFEETDRLGRGKCAGQLGSVSLERFDEARAAGQPASELHAHLNEAGRRYHEEIELLPPDAVDGLAVAHNALGLIYWISGGLDRALSHFRQSIHYEEAQGNLYGAAKTRFNIARALHSAGRRTDALEYAKAALLGYEAYGERAGDEIRSARGLIARIRR